MLAHSKGMHRQQFLRKQVHRKQGDERPQGSAPNSHDDKTERFVTKMKKALQQGFFLNRAVRCVDIINAPKK